MSGPSPESGSVEQSSQSSTDYAALYKEQHPNAETDSQRAEAMAHAANQGENGVIAARTESDALLEAASKTGILDHESYDASIEKRRSARVDANLSGYRAGVEYDQSKKA